MFDQIIKRSHYRQRHKAKALACWEVSSKKTKKHWRDDKNLMNFLDSL
jgi:hypothetical protein